MVTRSSNRKRKAEDVDQETNKRIKTSENEEKPVTENRLVVYQKPQEKDEPEPNKDEEETKTIPVDHIAISYDKNPLSSYDTFVCHLGNWKTPLANYLKDPCFRSIYTNVKREYEDGVCFPQKEFIFNAFQKTPFDKLKVVMIGQAPFYSNNDAMGLSYSVPRNAIWPDQTVSMFNALTKDPKVDFKVPNPLHGDLQNWANQGVLMLNNSLTVK